MKKTTAIIIITAAMACVSCTGIYFPYLNEQNEFFQRVDRPTPPHDWNLSMSGGKIRIDRSMRFKYTISISLIEEECVSLNLKTLCFFDDEGNAIPLDITYGSTFGLDSLKISISGNSASAIICDTTRTAAIFYLNAISTRPANSVKIKYDFDINGESFKGECFYRKRIMIESKPRLPWQPWYL